ncbi:uncharacterized protein LOC142453066 [Tenrec ecaudatus]|uniref:uncharacterized protein LOC142453066 n=1 Tax=Tenrec ecaudatus TaxID=94439 RepID=UPI003F5A44A1
MTCCVRSPGSSESGGRSRQAELNQLSCAPTRAIHREPRAIHREPRAYLGRTTEPPIDRLRFADSHPQRTAEAGATLLHPMAGLGTLVTPGLCGPPGAGDGREPRSTRRTTKPRRELSLRAAELPRVRLAPSAAAAAASPHAGPSRPRVDPSLQANLLQACLPSSDRDPLAASPRARHTTTDRIAAALRQPHRPRPPHYGEPGVPRPPHREGPAISPRTSSLRAPHSERPTARTASIRARLTAQERLSASLRFHLSDPDLLTPGNLERHDRLTSSGRHLGPPSFRYLAASNRERLGRLIEAEPEPPEHPGRLTPPSPPHHPGGGGGAAAPHRLSPSPPRHAGWPHRPGPPQAEPPLPHWHAASPRANSLRARLAALDRINGLENPAVQVQDHLPPSPPFRPGPLHRLGLPLSEPALPPWISTLPRTSLLRARLSTLDHLSPGNRNGGGSPERLTPSPPPYAEPAHHAALPPSGEPRVPHWPGPMHRPDRLTATLRPSHRAAPQHLGYRDHLGRLAGAGPLPPRGAGFPEHPPPSPDEPAALPPE